MKEEDEWYHDDRAIPDIVTTELVRKYKDKQHFTSMWENMEEENLELDTFLYMCGEREGEPHGGW